MTQSKTIKAELVTFDEASDRYERRVVSVVRTRDRKGPLPMVEVEGPRGPVRVAVSHRGRVNLPGYLRQYFGVESALPRTGLFVEVREGGGGWELAGLRGWKAPVRTGVSMPTTKTNRCAIKRSLQSRGVSFADDFYDLGSSEVRALDDAARKLKVRGTSSGKSRARALFDSLRRQRGC